MVSFTINLNAITNQSTLKNAKNVSRKTPSFSVSRKKKQKQKHA